MCIAVFIWQNHPLYPLLLLLNRDEFHDRPTKPIAWWEGCEILGGKDELAGGTWLACTRNGKLGFLTNVMEPPPVPEGKSRGGLVVQFLKSRKSPMEFAQEMIREADQYNGFNLVLTDIHAKTMVYVSNRPKGKPISVQVVSPGIHVLSNAQLDSPWNKAQRLSQNFKELLDKYKEDKGEGEVPMKEMVKELMRDTVRADESKLPGVRSPEYELKASSIFVEFDTPKGRYGTRSTAALSVTTSGRVSVYEEYLEKETWKVQTVDYQIIENVKEAE
ncbi:Protein of unknown function DUF833 [Macleaya cordata]|uniref:Transport and Golgi organization protein 2 n=1 Tax=Macleaya cordata TaxID=56857 RepID=A0A200PQY1_MACCD|nr:Protein of unknown function DUF833 [Macleaya cordata]